MDSENLSKIDEIRIDSLTTVLGEKSKGRFAEETKFKLYLKNDAGETSENSVVQGRYYAGRGKYYRPWIEVNFTEEVDFKSSTTTLSDEDLEKLFQNISNTVPPTGWIFAIYEDHEETREGLNRQIPPAATRIGYFLYRAGCVWYKNWYFTEGGREGRKKLQGEKPPDDEAREESLLEIHQQLSDFLGDEEKREEKIFENARGRAKKIIKEIEEEGINPEPEGEH